MKAGPANVQVGDPITLKMTVRGEGNLSTLRPPKLNLGDDFKVYDPETKNISNGRVFEQVVIPKSDRVTEIPEVSFSFFDTSRGKYRTITKGPVPITVTPLPAGEELKIYEGPLSAGGLRRDEILGRDIIYIKSKTGGVAPIDEYICDSRIFRAVLFLPILAVITGFFVQRRMDRLSSDIGYARRIHAPRKARSNLAKVRRLLESDEGGRFYDAVFVTLREYLGDKYHLASAGITVDVVDELKSRNVNSEALDKIRRCLEGCDMARYAPSGITRGTMKEMFMLLTEIIDRLERGGR